MFHRVINWCLLFLLCLFASGGIGTISTPAQDNTPAAPIVPQVIPPETEVQRLRLTNPAASGGNEYSGLAWYGETLVFLPQFPEYELYTLEKSVIETGGTAPTYDPDTLAFRLNGELDVPNFEGYEAIAFYEDTVYLTIEAAYDRAMRSFLISGTVSETGIDIDIRTLVEVPQPVSIENKSHESIVMVDNQPLLIYEWNSTPNMNPVAQLYSPETGTFTEIPFPEIPYRITDATAMDEEGRFWVINYLPPTEGQRRDTGILEQLNYRDSHGRHQHLERLLQLQLVDDEIVLLDDTPLYLELEDEARNWEGIVTINQRGILLITDSYPTTVFGYLRLPS